MRMLKLVLIASDLNLKKGKNSALCVCVYHMCVLVSIKHIIYSICYFILFTSFYFFVIYIYLYQTLDNYIMYKTVCSGSWIWWSRAFSSHGIFPQSHHRFTICLSPLATFLWQSWRTSKPPLFYKYYCYCVTECSFKRFSGENVDI